MREDSDSKSKNSEDDIIEMLEFLIDNIFVIFRVRFSTYSRYSSRNKLHPSYEAELICACSLCSQREEDG